MAIENLQKSEGIASHKSSLLNSHVSQPGTFFEKDKNPSVGSVFSLWSLKQDTLPTACFTYLLHPLS